MSSSLVSILIPVYNRECLIEETLRSAMRQTYQDYEVIVVDNCSTDSTYDVLLKLQAEHPSRIRVFRNESNLGPVGNWKQCLRRARGQYVKILWSDDLMRSDFLERSIPILESDDNVAFVYSKVTIFSETFRRDYYRIGRTGVYGAEVFLRGTAVGSHYLPVSPGCALFRRRDVVITDDVPNELGVDHSRTGAGTDLLIFLNALEGHKAFYYIDEAMCSFRAHDGSISLISDLRDEYLTAKFHYFKTHRTKMYLRLLNTVTFLSACIRARRLTWPIDVLGRYYSVDERAMCKLIVNVYLARHLVFKACFAVKRSRGAQA